MLDDFTPIIHRLDGRTVKLYPIADVHIGAKEADVGGFADFLKHIESDDDAYICIVGDLLNNATRSSVSDVYQETMSPSAAVDYATELLMPVADKILGCVGGNHEARSRRDVDLDPLYKVMALIRKPELYRQNMAFIRIILGKGSTRDNYAIMMAHGKTANKKKQFTSICEGVDACIFAHTHTPDVSIPSRIRFTTSNRVKMHNVVSITACSWLKAGGYSLANLYPPQVVSRPQALLLEYTGSNKTRGDVRIVW